MVHLVIAAHGALPEDLVLVPPLAVEEVFERRLEPAFDLARVGTDGKVGGHGGEDRGDVEAGAGLVAVGRPDDAHRLARDAEFLPGLAQGRLHRILARIDLPAGKGDLPRVIAHGARALGEEDRGVFGLGHRDEDGGIGGAVEIGKARVGKEVLDLSRMPLLEQLRQAVEQSAHSGRREKVTPPLVTVQSSPCANAIRASCS